MTDFQRHIAQAEPIEIRTLDLLVARYPWFSAARIIRRRLNDQAIDIYRKLSLLNSEKSVYFAGLIAKIERKQNN